MKDCLKDKHIFYDIFISPEKFGLTNIVRWCVRCGAIRIDLSYDGKELQGEIVPTTLPNYFWLIKESDETKIQMAIDDM